MNILKFVWDYTKRVLSNEKGFWPLVALIAGAAMKAGSEASKKQEGGDLFRVPWADLQDQQISTGEKYGDWINKYMNQYKPGEDYTGPISSEMSPWEKTGMSLLSQYLSGGKSDLTGAASDQILKTLSGGYMDPASSPYIQAMMKLNKQNVADSIRSSRLSQGYRNKFLSRSALQEEGNIRERNANNLDAIIGSFLQGERNNQLSVLPQAMTMGRAEQQLPYEKAMAAQNLGVLPRTLDEANMERAYQQWARKRGELAGVQNTASNFAFQQLPYGLTEFTTPIQTTKPMWGNILGGLGGGLMSYGSGGLAGDTGWQGILAKILGGMNN